MKKYLKGENEKSMKCSRLSKYQAFTCPADLPSRVSGIKKILLASWYWARWNSMGSDANQAMCMLWVLKPSKRRKSRVKKDRFMELHSRAYSTLIWNQASTKVKTKTFTVKALENAKIKIGLLILSHSINSRTKRLTRNKWAIS